MGTITTAEIYAGLRFSQGFRWEGSPVTYSLPVADGSVWSTGSYGPTSEPFNADYGVLSAAQRIGFTNAIGAWERLIDVDLVEVPDTAVGSGQIRIAFTDAADQGHDGSAAYAYTPPQPGFSGTALNGDIWIDDQYKGDDASAGTFLYETFLHELGHALGLKHPFEGTALPAEFDNTRYTIMSYTEFSDSAFRTFALQGNSLLATTSFVSISTPMLLDIIAIQGIYGAANTAELGANTYTFDESRPMMMTLVDNGGVDTFDLSAHARASSVNLTPGSFSSIAQWSIASQIAFWTARFPNFSPSFISGFLDKADTYTWTDNVALSLGTVIENVLGGAGADTITGNTASNSLSGGAGGDQIFGGTGNDTIIGGAGGGSYLRGDEGNDTISGGEGFDDANGNMGNDTVSTGAGDDFCVGGKDNDLLFGDAGGDFVYGNLGDDTCNGGDGNDTVRGGQGTDTLSGGAGNDFVSGDRGDDTMTGGAGADLFHSSGDAGIDRVLDFSVAEGDRVLLDPGTTFILMQVGGDTVVMMSAGQVVLVGVSMASLTSGSVFVG